MARIARDASTMSEQTKGDRPAVVAAVYEAVLCGGSMSAFLGAIALAIQPFHVELVVREEPVSGGGGPESAPDDPVERAASDAPNGELNAEIDAANLDNDPREPIVLGRFGESTAAMNTRLVMRWHDAAADPKQRRRVVLADLADHIARAIRIRRDLVGHRLQAEAAHGALDTLPLGVIVADGAGRVLRANRPAQAMLDKADGLSIDRTGLCATSSKDTQRMRRIIAQVSEAGSGGDRTPVGVLRLDRPSLSPDWLVVITPLVAHVGGDAGEGSAGESQAMFAALFISDADGPPDIPSEALERLFELTPAESRLLVALVRGHSLDEAAELYKVSKNTLRNQLNQVFRKTETSKQSELVRMVLTSPAPILMSAARGKRIEGSD